MLQLLSLPLLFLSPLPLRAIVQQKRQSTAERENDERLENVRVDFVAVIAVTAVNVVFIIIRLIVVPTGEFGFEERAEPLGEGEVLLDGCRIVSI